MCMYTLYTLDAESGITLKEAERERETERD